MTTHLEEVVKGFNKEKEILTVQLTICNRSKEIDIRSRLREIDIRIQELLQAKELLK